MKPLSLERSQLNGLVRPDLLTAIKDRREAIRYHRDQLGDDRCWLDDGLVWAALDTTAPEAKVLPDYEKMMEHCSAFFYKRQEKSVAPVGDNIILDKTRWDADLDALSNAGLLDVLTALQQAIAEHRDKGQLDLTVADDKKLYEILPEKLRADFRLPSKEAFIDGTVDPCAGCPNFWKSHQGCQTKEHNLRKWGKC